MSAPFTVENAFIESFNGKLRDECLNSHIFASVAEAQVVLDAWREDYNAVRRHSALQDRAPAAVGALWVDSRDARESTAMKNDGTELEITALSRSSGVALLGSRSLGSGIRLRNGTLHCPTNRLPR